MDEENLWETAGNECLKKASFLPRYFVFVDGQQVAEIIKEFTFLSPKS